MPEELRIKFKALFPIKGDVVENGELLIEQGHIKEICPRQTESLNIECLDLSDHLILPGFVNAHCHLSLSALHGRVPRCEKFTDWVLALLKENIQLSWYERVQAMQSGAVEMLRSGVTTLADNMSQPELLPEYAVLSFRQVLFLEVLGFKKSMVQDTLDRVIS
ncbi:MAG: amidohydrolase family protein, partial [Nitrospinales bacterium]